MTGGRLLRYGLGRTETAWPRRNAGPPGPPGHWRLPSRGEAISSDEGQGPSQVLGRDDQHDEAREQQTQQTEQAQHQRDRKRQRMGRAGGNVGYRWLLAHADAYSAYPGGAV